MDILPILIVIVSVLNDVLDFVTGYFPGVNEVITMIFDMIIGMLIFFEFIQRRIKREKNLSGMIVKKILTLLVASLAESLPVFDLLPFQTIGAVFMGMIRPGTQKK